METKINELAKQAGITPDVSGRWYSSADLNKLSSLIIEECILAVRNCSKGHGSTTFDSSLISRTIEESVKSIKSTFEIK